MQVILFTKNRNHFVDAPIFLHIKTCSASVASVQSMMLIIL